ncbi:MAG: biotin-dependent carboxyltransferase family protein [Devosia sp.]
MTVITITRAGPLATLQDAGRFGMLAHGISASGPMDTGAFEAAGVMLDRAGSTAIEFTAAALSFTADGPLRAACAGGNFKLSVNSNAREWPARVGLVAGDTVEITPGPAGNYGYLRFGREIDIAPVLGSRSTNLAVGLGGLNGRALKAGDRIVFGEEGSVIAHAASAPRGGPIRVLWGLHADLFDRAVRQRLVETIFRVSPTLDRMGVRLIDEDGLFQTQRKLSLVSDAIVAGDIQILGDGTPIVLMRDHQPTGGYPRVATVVTADLDRLAQLRPGSEVSFQPVTLEHAR